MSDVRARLAEQMRDQARSCAEMGSPLYGDLLTRAAEDAEAGGPLVPVLEPHVRPGRGDALALRLMAAVHRLVLTGRAPALALHYPSAGGDAGLAGAWDAFRDLLVRERDLVRELAGRPCQTNEVGRSAPLMLGFLETAARTRLPFRLLEIGASAGLNLRFDHFRFGGAGVAWGPADSPVDLGGYWADAPPFVDAEVVVASRDGCDPRPLDPRRADDRLTLESSVWADQTTRFRRLRGALALAERVPATVSEAAVTDWLPAQLEAPRPGVVTVVYHSVVEEYLPDPMRASFHAAMAEAGARATEEAPLAWVRLEPVTALRQHAVTLRLWPHDPDERRLGLSGAHGTGVQLSA